MTEFDNRLTGFFDRIVATGELFTFMDDEGIVTPKNQDGERAMPYWSSLQGVHGLLSTLDGDMGYRPIRIALAEFERAWLPGIARDGYLIGIDWVGKPPSGYDLPPQDFRRHLERARSHGSP